MNTSNLPEKLKDIQLLLLDVDGVLTDGSIIFSDEASETKVFNVKDGLGLKLIMEAGIKVGLVTGRTSKALHRRCHDLLTDFLCFEETAVTKNLVDLHLLLFKEDVQTDPQCPERREQMHTHEVCKGETAFRCTNEQWTPFLKVRDMLA